MSRRLLFVAILFLWAAFATSPSMASVRCVQESLELLGYSPGPIDGILGPDTSRISGYFTSDYGLRLPRLTISNSGEWCAAMRMFTHGVGAVALDPNFTETGTPAGSGQQCTTDPPKQYARKITGQVQGDPLTLTVSSRVGGAIESVVWRNKEFINNYDHGRQISYAWHLDGYGECFNPTEPGSAADNFKQTSTSVLMSVCSDGPNNLTTISRPAFWLGPNETGFCDRGATVAINQNLLSDQVFEKEITIGYQGLENVIAFEAQITLEKDYQSLQTEMPTGYLTYEFTERYVFNPLTGELTSPESQPLVRPWSYNYASGMSPILATPDGSYAMGAYTAEPILVYEILFYDVANPQDTTNKWNMVIREQPAPAGDYTYVSFAIVGTLQEVQKSMMALYQLHPTDFNPPQGYVDQADCESISGWAWDPKSPDEPVTIEIFDLGEDGERTLLFSGSADQFRSDLVPVLKDNGRHGFRFWTYQIIKDNNPHTLVVEARNSVAGLKNYPLIPSQQTLKCAN